MKTKHCKKCNKNKLVTNFRKKGNSLQAYCIACNKAYQKEHYQKHKANYKADALERKWKIRYNALMYVMEYAQDGCSVCGETDFITLEFDHIDPTIKTMNIGQMVSSGYSIKRISEELEKCQILCANCHRKKTSEQFNWYSNLLKKAGVV